MPLPQKSKIAPVRLSVSHSAWWLEEPALQFAEGGSHWDPKVGIALYGPRSFGTGRHKGEVHVGFVGTGEGVDRGRSFYADYARGIDGDDEHAPFPGCSSDTGFRTRLSLNPEAQEVISRKEMLDLSRVRGPQAKFEALVKLLEAKLSTLSEHDHPLDYVVIVLPEALYRRYRVVEYRDKTLGFLQRNLRRAFKAVAMRYRVPTQILLETTTGLVPTGRQLEHPTVIAWNLFTGLYSKVDGLPWGPTELAPATCFVGISFYRPLGEASVLRTSVVQAFDENGEGLVLRGHSFPWDEQRKGKTPHLPEDLAGKLIEMVLDRYQQERGHFPRRVVVQKTSEFDPLERRGLENALTRVDAYDLVALRPTSDVRLLRTGRYPPLRGTVLTLGEADYLYTTGYSSEAGRYPHGHVPSPLQVTDHVGDTPIRQLLREILVLTKMNWNSAADHGLMPVTLRFARLVGDILREVPSDQVPQVKYRYYM